MKTNSLLIYIIIIVGALLTTSCYDPPKKKASPEYERGYNAGMAAGEAKGYKKGFHAGQIETAKAFNKKEVTHGILGSINPEALKVASFFSLIISIFYLVGVIIFLFPKLSEKEVEGKTILAPDESWEKGFIAKLAAIIGSIILSFILLNTINLYWFMGDNISSWHLLSFFLSAGVVFLLGFLASIGLDIIEGEERARFHGEAFLILIATFLLIFFIYILVQFDLFFSNTIRSGSAVIMGAGFGFLTLVFRHFSNKYLAY